MTRGILSTIYCKCDINITIEELYILYKITTKKSNLLEFLNLDYILQPKMFTVRIFAR